MTYLDVLQKTFGYKEFRPGQEKIIQTLLSGRDCLGIMPTGAGKSVTFQIPARVMKGTVLVISPLISLMKDQVDSLKELGFKAEAINSTVPAKERSRRLDAFRAGAYELVYLAPEALEGSLGNFLQTCPVSMVAVDEAHCISQWGHDFRPAYRKLQGLKMYLGNIPVLALTATATEQVMDDIVKQLGMKDPLVYKGSFFRSNLKLTFYKKGKGINTRQAVVGYIRKHMDKSGIIYCWSRRNVEGMAKFLNANGIKALPYHAGLSTAERTRNQDDFLRDRADVVVATIAFGMGINKSNVRFVIHCDMPKTVENYYQEIGRAGRDGLDSDCILFYSWADVINYERFSDHYTDEARAEASRQKTIAMFRLAESNTCRHKAVLSYFDEAIGECGKSCDICTGRSLEKMIDTRRAAKAPGQSGKIQFAAAQTATPDNSLFSELKKIRRALADSQNVPAYIVFSDAALQSMASIKPRNEDEMLGVSGVGEVKLKKYGRTFLKAIADFESKNKPAINAGIKSARSVYDDPRVSIIEAKYKTCPMKRETATFENRAIVEKARAQHRRAYEPWGSEEDKELDDIYKEIKDVDTLCSIFKRNPGAISSRLKKHEEGRS